MPNEPATDDQRLQVGHTAPLFTATTADGRPIALADFRDKLLWLVFFRYAACPFCSYRIATIMREYKRIEAAGLSLLAVFPSPPERITKYLDRFKPAFDTISDPEEKLYELYHTETSWLGELRSAVNIPAAVRALVLAPNNPFAVDGPMHRMPAEFLLRRDLTIGVARYGNSLSDGIPLEEVIAWAESEAV